MSEFDGIDFSAPVAPAINDDQEFSGIDFTAREVAEPEKADSNGFIDRAGARLGERNTRMREDVRRMVTPANPQESTIDPAQFRATPEQAGQLETILSPDFQGGNMASELKAEASPQEAMFNIAGELAGSALDVLGEAGVSVAKSIADASPDFLKEYASEEAAAIAKGIAQSAAGQSGLKAMEGGVEVYREWRAENPRVARALEGFINIGLVFAPVKTKAKSEPSLLSKTADKVKALADQQFAKDRGAFITDLIGPKRDFKVLKKEVPRTQEAGSGPFKRSIVEPTTREKAVAEEVSKIKGVNHEKSIQGNYNVISDENARLAVSLEDDVARAKVKIPQQEVLQKVDDVIDEAISSNMFIVGTGENAGEKLRLQVGKIILKHSDADGTIKGESLLAARKELDAVIRAQKPTMFNPDTAQSAIEIIAKATRNSMNDILDASITGNRAIDLKVKNELRRQSLLFSAMDNIVPKAAVEANTAIARSIQNAMKVVPVRNEAVQLLAMSAGVGGLGAAAMAAPIVRDAGIIAGTIYGAYKGATSVGLKRLTANTLKLVDEAIRTTESPAMLKTLRADRALIVEMLKNTVGHGEANKPIPTEPEQ